MPDLLTYWRKTDRANARCQALRVGASHPCGDHVGDFVTAVPADWAAKTSDADRKSFALIIVTDIPEELVTMAGTRPRGKLMERLREGTCLADRAIDRPRVTQVKEALLAGELPAQSSALADLFDAKKTVSAKDIPRIPWEKFRLAVWDKVREQVEPDDSWTVSRGVE